MKESKIQKSFYLSSSRIKELIEKRSADLASKRNSSNSLVLEQVLMEGLFPKNKEAEYLIRNLLYSGEQNNVKRTLDIAFSNNAAGIEWKAVHNNFLPLVMLCEKYYRGPKTFSGKEQELPHLISQIKTIESMIENCVNSTINSQRKIMIKNEFNVAKQLIECVGNEPSKICPCRFFKMISDFFFMLDDWSITYRALSDLVQMSIFEESADSRNDLFDIINDMSTDWEPKKSKVIEDDPVFDLFFYLNRVELKVSQEDRFADGCLTVYANSASVGYLSTNNAATDQLLWTPDPGNPNPRYQFLDEDIFREVVAELKRYKDKHGYKYLVISSYCGGFANILNLAMLRRTGFKQLDGYSPGLYFLE